MCASYIFCVADKCLKCYFTGRQSREITSYRTKGFLSSYSLPSFMRAFWGKLILFFIFVSLQMPGTQHIADKPLEHFLSGFNIQRNRKCCLILFPTMTCTTFKMLHLKIKEQKLNTDIMTEMHIERLQLKFRWQMLALNFGNCHVFQLAFQALFMTATEGKWLAKHS